MEELSMIFLHIRTRFADAFFPRLSEWVAAAVICGCAWMLAVNKDLMASAPKPFQLMLDVATQPTWAKVCLFLGAARLIILFINGAWRRSPHARSMMATLSCFLWMQIVLSFSATLGLSVVGFAGFLVMDFLNIIRAARDARTVDDAYAGSRIGGPL